MRFSSIWPGNISVAVLQGILICAGVQWQWFCISTRHQLGHFNEVNLECFCDNMSSVCHSFFYTSFFCHPPCQNKTWALQDHHCYKAQDCPLNLSYKNSKLRLKAEGTMLVNWLSKRLKILSFKLPNSGGIAPVKELTEKIILLACVSIYNL